MYSKKSCHHLLDRLASRLQLNIFSEVDITTFQAPTIPLFVPHLTSTHILSSVSILHLQILQITSSNTNYHIPLLSHLLLFKAKKYRSSICMQVYYVGPSYIIWWLVSTITCWCIHQMCAECLQASWQERKTSSLSSWSVNLHKLDNEQMNR